MKGHNRANASIIEACILASRIGMISKRKILNELEYLSIGVEKTSGESEEIAWKKINSFILKKLNEKNNLKINSNMLVSFKSQSEISEKNLKLVDILDLKNPEKGSLGDWKNFRN